MPFSAVCFTLGPPQPTWIAPGHVGLQILHPSFLQGRIRVHVRNAGFNFQEDVACICLCWSSELERPGGDHVSKSRLDSRGAEEPSWAPLHQPCPALLCACVPAAFFQPHIPAMQRTDPVCGTWYRINVSLFWLHLSLLRRKDSFNPNFRYSSSLHAGLLPSSSTWWWAWWHSVVAQSFLFTFPKWLFLFQVTLWCTQAHWGSQQQTSVTCFSLMDSSGEARS